MTVIWNKTRRGFLSPSPTTTTTTPSSDLMVSTRRQRGKTRTPTEGTPPSAGNGDEYEERTPEPRKTRGTKRAKTTAGGKQQRKHHKKAKLSRLPDMPIDILYEVRRALSCACVIPDAMRFPDIFSRPPQRSNADLLDFKDPQQISHKQIIPPPLAGCFRDGPGGRQAATLSFRDYRNGLRESFVWSTLHGSYIIVNPPAGVSNQMLQNCANPEARISAWTVLVRICGSCLEEMYFLCFPPTPSERSTIPLRAIDFNTPWDDNGIAPSIGMSTLPSFCVLCTCVFP